MLFQFCFNSVTNPPPLIPLIGSLEQTYRIPHNHKNFKKIKKNIQAVFKSDQDMGAGVVRLFHCIIEQSRTGAIHNGLFQLPSPTCIKGAYQLRLSRRCISFYNKSMRPRKHSFHWADHLYRNARRWALNPWNTTAHPFGNGSIY